MTSTYAQLAPSNATASLLTLAHNAEAIAERLSALCGDVKSKESRALASALDAVPAALSAIPQTVAEAMTLAENPVYKARDKHRVSTSAISSAEAAAVDALSSAKRAAQACRASLEASMSVKQPTNDPMLPFTAGELAKLVEQRVGSNPAQLPFVVSDLLSAALARDAQTEVYVLTSALWPTYARLGASSDTATALRKAIAQALGAAKSQDPDNAGAALLSELSEQGGAFVKWAQAVEHLIKSHTQPALERINRGYAAGAMSDGPLPYDGR